MNEQLEYEDAREYERSHKEQDIDPNEELQYELHRILRKLVKSDLTIPEFRTLCYATGVNVRDVT